MKDRYICESNGLLMNYIKYAQTQLGPIIPALIIGMLVFAAPKILHDSYMAYKDFFSHKDSKSDTHKR